MMLLILTQLFLKNLIKILNFSIRFLLKYSKYIHIKYFNESTCKFYDNKNIYFFDETHPSNFEVN